MFGLLKIFRRKFAPAPGASQPVALSTYVSTAAPVAPPEREPEPAATTIDAVLEALPAPQVPEPALPARPKEPEFSAETVDVPYKTLWPKLGADVTRCAPEPPARGAMLRLPLNIVQAQLARGAIKIPFAQLCRFSPEGLFQQDGTNEILEVVIPIEEVLARVTPAQLPRRAGQRKVEVPDDIAPIFGPSGGGAVRLADGKTKPPAAKPEAATEHRETPATAPVPAASIQPASPIAPIPSRAPVPVAAPVAPASAATAPAAATTPTTPIAAGPISAGKLDPSLATLGAKPSGPVFNLALMDLAAFWSENGHKDLEALYRNSLEIPVRTLEAALKKGKIEFEWREIRPWVRLAPGSTLPNFPNDKKIVFPLALVAPRFLEEHSASQKKKRLEIGSDIPDVFLRSAAAEQPVPPSPAPQAKEAGPVRNGHASPRQFGEIFGQPEKTNWSLGEVSQRVTTLPGVTGAIIATADGLLVAGSWPGEIGGEAVAAFVPQMYNRMTKYTNELRLGSPGNFTLLIENVPLQIFKAADSYFTVLGRAGETLPVQELNAIATRLALNSTAN